MCFSVHFRLQNKKTKVMLFSLALSDAFLLILDTVFVDSPN